MSLYKADHVTLSACFWRLAFTHLAASMTYMHTISAALCEKQVLHASQYKISIVGHDTLRMSPSDAV